MYKIEKVDFLCKIEGKFASTDSIAHSYINMCFFFFFFPIKKMCFFFPCNLPLPYLYIMGLVFLFGVNTLLVLIFWDHFYFSNIKRRDPIAKGIEKFVEKQYCSTKNWSCAQV